MKHNKANPRGRPPRSSRGGGPRGKSKRRVRDDAARRKSKAERSKARAIQRILRAADREFEAVFAGMQTPAHARVAQMLKTLPLSEILRMGALRKPTKAGDRGTKPIRRHSRTRVTGTR